MDFKLIGSILLIVGTSIGAGMLALPIATSQLGFLGSIILLVVCWFVMTTAAFYILESNLWMPQNSNLTTMAKVTIGPLGQIVSWVTYLLLLYSLLCAYISAGSDLLHHLLLLVHVDIPLWLSTILFTLLFGAIVSLGIRAVDYANRGFISLKFAAYFVLIFLLIPFISGYNLTDGNLKFLSSSTAITVTITSFGYATIIPSLRVYFAGDIKKLKKVIVIGSIIPLICYIFWDLVIMGVIPLEGPHGLIAILKSDLSTSDFVQTLSDKVVDPQVTFFAKLFTSVCVLTSFLGVALCLTDFLADGLQLEKKGKQNLIVQIVTFLPPLITVIFFPNVFIKALQYAGIYCAILLILLPALMVWYGRYRKGFQKEFQVPGGKVLLSLLIIVSIALVLWGAIGWF